MMEPSEFSGTSQENHETFISPHHTVLHNMMESEYSGDNSSQENHKTLSAPQGGSSENFSIQPPENITSSQYDRMIWPEQKAYVKNWDEETLNSGDESLATVSNPIQGSAAILSVQKALEKDPDTWQIEIAEVVAKAVRIELAKHGIHRQPEGDKGNSVRREGRPLFFKEEKEALNLQDDALNSHQENWAVNQNTVRHTGAIGGIVPLPITAPHPNTAEQSNIAVNVEDSLTSYGATTLGHDPAKLHISNLRRAIQKSRDTIKKWPQQIELLEESREFLNIAIDNFEKDSIQMRHMQDELARVAKEADDERFKLVLFIQSHLEASATSNIQSILNLLSSE